MSSRVNEVNGENFQDPPIKNPGYANDGNIDNFMTKLHRQLNCQSYNSTGVASAGARHAV